MMLGIALGSCKKPVRKYIPTRAYKYFPMVIESNIEYLPELVIPDYFGGLIEHESCITLCSKRCWNPKSRLKTKREEGAGLGQLTRVFNRNGTVRWDMLRTLRLRHPKELKELTWNNIYKRPDLQIKALVLLWRDDYEYLSKSIRNKKEIQWFVDSAYNGGFKWLNRERIMCKFTKGCDPDLWFNNVEKMKSRRARRKLYGTRTAWDINRHHVRDVRLRSKKYKKLETELLEKGFNCDM